MPEEKPLETPPAGLRRDLSLLDAVGVGVGAILGAGLYVVTGLAAGAAGPAFLVGLLLAGMAAACNALSSAQLAATYPQSGGTYEYGYRVLRPEFGFAAGWMFLASKLAAGGAVALGFGSYLARLVPGLELRLAALAAVVLLTLANLGGIKKAGRLNLLIVAVTLLTLLWFLLGGIPAFRRENLLPFAPQGARGILESAALLFFAYTGYARIATLGEEVREPRRTIPRAIILSLFGTMLLYFVVTLAAVGAVGAGRLAETRTPLERAAQSFALPGSEGAVILGAMTAMLGVLLSQLLGISRMMVAMARRGDLFPALEAIAPRHAAPVRAVLLSGLIIALLAAFGTPESIVPAASFTILLYYSITNLAALRMNPADRLFPNWIPRIGLAFCLLLALSLTPRIILAGLALLVLGFALRWLLHRFLNRARSLHPQPKAD